MMQGISMKWFAAALSLAFSSWAGASGFQLLEQSASGIGNAFAGSAAGAENAAALYFNPALMTQLSPRELSLGLAGVKPNFRFHDAGSTVGTLGSSGSGGDAGGWETVPNAYTAWAIGKDLYLGLGIGAPFGLRTEYDERWLGAAQSTRFEIRTINLNPTLAYRVNDKLALGFGLNWQKLDAKYERLAGTSAGLSRVKSSMRLDDSAWGWNVGVLVTLSPAMKLGLSYRSRIQFDTHGDVQLMSDGSALGNAVLVPLQAGGQQGDVQAGLTLPDTFILSVAQTLDDRWEMLGDVSWTGWRSIPKVDIRRSSGALAGQNAQTLETNFRNAWRVALGANYTLNGAWKLKFGLAYDQTPVRGAATRLLSLPDNNRIWISTGAQWRLDKSSRLDFGLAYIHVRDSQVDNEQTAQLRGRVRGDYDGDIWVMGAQYSLSF